jgi:hypothetical protein
MWQVACAGLRVRDVAADDRLAPPRPAPTAVSNRLGGTGGGRVAVLEWGRNERLDKVVDTRGAPA